jgi:hypothetical protein
VTIQIVKNISINTVPNEANPTTIPKVIFLNVLRSPLINQRASNKITARDNNTNPTMYKTKETLGKVRLLRKKSLYPITHNGIAINTSTMAMSNKIMAP